MEIKVFGKKDCGLCEAAKEKLDKMGLEYQVMNIEDFTTHREGWRDDESVDVTATYYATNSLPIIEIDCECMTYPEAMKKLRRGR